MINEELSNVVFAKGGLKKQVYEATSESFRLFKLHAEEIVQEFQNEKKTRDSQLSFIYKNRGDFEFEIRFAGDVLIFAMHTNVFETPRNHDIMKTSYVRQDTNRSYCGVVNIYNFLADSFDYDRDNDIGYLIGRVFINSEKHFFIEGKKELGLMHNSFGISEINDNLVRKIIESAIEYTINFDLLIPPYDEVKLVSVVEMKQNFDHKQMVTGKRLGFRFQADTE